MPGWSKPWFKVERRAGGHYLRYFWFCRFFWCKNYLPLLHVLSARRRCCVTVVTWVCHNFVMSSWLCHGCVTVVTMPDITWQWDFFLGTFVMWYSMTWHNVTHCTVTQMSHTIAQKCHTYDEPVTLEILVDIDTCRFRWFSIRLVFGSIRSIGQLVAGQED